MSGLRDELETPPPLRLIFEAPPFTVHWLDRWLVVDDALHITSSRSLATYVGEKDGDGDGDHTRQMRQVRYRCQGKEG